MSIQELKKLAKRFGDYSLFGILLRQVQLFESTGTEVTVHKVGTFFILVEVP